MTHLSLPLPPFATCIQILKFYWKYDVNISRIESRPSKRAEGVFDMYVDFEGTRGEEKVDFLLHALDKHINSILLLDNKEVRICGNRL